MGDLGHAARDDVLLGGVVEIGLVVDLLALQGVGADVEMHALALEVGDLVLHVRVLVRHLQQGEPRAVHDHPHVDVVLAHGVDVVLDVAHGGLERFFVIHVDVVGDLLLAVVFRVRRAQAAETEHGHQNQTEKFFHEHSPDVDGCE